jgi:hypothetical protein
MRWNIMARGIFVTLINCMDGRVQIPAIEYLKEKYEADYVDSITEPGPIRYLSENTDKCILGSINDRIRISVEKHGSKLIAIAGHFDCAGNPVGKEVQLRQLEEAAEMIKLWYPDAEIIKLWIDENWEVVKVQV